MKRILVLLMFLSFLTGCNKLNIDLNDYDLIFNTFLKEETSLVNNYSSGYKYYLPPGVRLINKNNYNEKLYYDGFEYYLYADVVSYYYKTSINNNIEDNLYYTKEISYNDKNGYVNIYEENDMFKVVIYYNYARIEAYVDYDKLGQSLINMCYILNSIEFNDSVLKVIVGEESTKLTEETFDFYTPRKEGNFIEYINKYDEYEEPSDQNIIWNEGNE